jgi:hypothetical protein
MVGARSDGQLGALLAACALALAGDPDSAPFAAALATIDPQPAYPAVPPGRLPVLHWWDDALRARGVDDANGHIAAAVHGLRTVLTFTQNPNYVAAPPSAAFLGRYGYAVLAGPRSGPPALVEQPELAFGVLLLGPDTTYPTHVHPAAELYLPLGTARWSAGGRPLSERPPGLPIVHAPNEPHETRTGSSPLAALYVWLGELETAAQILALPPDSRDPE